MLQISAKEIINSGGERIFLHGIALGGWLMMEGYMLGGENIPETAFRKMLEDDLAAQFAAAGEEPPRGEAQALAEEFKWEFRRRFFTEKDADRVRELGFNCVRIPFNHKLIESSPFKIDPRGMEILHAAVNWFAARNIYVILEMHAVPGCQNRDWHSDSDGEMDFYTNPESRQRFVWLWQELSKVFKGEEWVAAYDIMNEPVVRNPDAGEIVSCPGAGPNQRGNPELEVLKDTFRTVIKTIREQGDRHIIFLEGHQWAQRVEFLADVVEENRGNNVGLSVHFYEPTDFTFNTDPTLRYPGAVHGKKWDRTAIMEYLSQYAQYNVPVYVGEFGVSTGYAAKEDPACPAADDKYRWVEDVVSVMRELGCHWTYWTYKSMAGMPWPDGVYQFFEPGGSAACPGQPAAIFAKGTDHAGMKNIGRQLIIDKKRFYEHLDTNKFELNQRILNIIH